MSVVKTINTAITLLQTGIESDNWGLVQSALYLLQGEKETTATEKPLKEKTSKGSPGRLQQQLPVKQKISSSKAEEMDFSVERPSKKRQRVKGVNKFDDMVKSISLEEDPDVFNAINDNVKPTPRRRPKYKPITVQCTQCDEDSIVNPALVADRNSFVCAKCIEKRVKGRR